MSARAEAIDITTPTPRRERLALLDALRGFALLLVLFANLRALSLYDLLPAETAAQLPTAAFDRGIAVAFAALIDGKAFTLFTILFGIGFSLQMGRAGGSGEARGRYLRRLLILFAIGAVHVTFWYGDILHLYGLLGLLLIPFACASARTLVVAGLLIAVFTTPFLRTTMAGLLPQISSGDTASAAALGAFQGNNIVETVRSNLAYGYWTRISAWGLPFYILGRLLIGAALGRSEALFDPMRHRHFWKRLLLGTLLIGVPLTLFLLLRDQGMLGTLSAWWKTEAGRIATRICRSLASLALGLSYLAGFVLLFNKQSWQRCLLIFAPVGRMALTNYLLQSLAAMALFYGIGLGIGPRYGLVGVLVGGVLLFIVQIALSHWWLARYQFGPAEWLWRCLTYGRVFTLRQAD